MTVAGISGRETLLFVAASAAVNVTLFDGLPFDLLRDIAPVSGLISGHTAGDHPRLAATCRPSPDISIHRTPGRRELSPAARPPARLNRSSFGKAWLSSADIDEQS
jgi:hypothetical protein